MYTVFGPEKYKKAMKTESCTFRGSLERSAKVKVDETAIIYAHLYIFTNG